MSGDQMRGKEVEMNGIQARFCVNWPGFKLDVNLDLPHVGVSALFGHSGSGKTTLLRCLAGLERASEGFLIVNGAIWQDEKHWLPVHKRPLGYVFQEASLFDHLSVMGNLCFGMRRNNNEHRVSLDQAIALLGIEPLLERKPNRLSGGERQRVAIARALAVSPRLLLMDEPLAALDLKRKQEILPYLERLHDELEIPIIYVSHSPDEVVRLADYIVAMESGQVIAQGPLTETLTRMDLPLKIGEDVCAILPASICAVDPQWSLSKVCFSGGELWLRDRGLPVGRRVRIRVYARDVSLAKQRPDQTSIQNTMLGNIDAIGADEHPGLAIIRVKIGDSRLVARVTKRAIAELEFSINQEVWVQVKTVALME
jgi:molybdate transport system ATP-binding protein